MVIASRHGGVGSMKAIRPEDYRVFLALERRAHLSRVAELKWKAGQAPPQFWQPHARDRGRPVSESPLESMALCAPSAGEKAM
jgi:hypothetical protein